MSHLLRQAALPFARSLLAALLCLALAGTAWARELVILVQPSKSSPELREAFNRLRGELALHGFDVEVVTVDESLSSEQLSKKADDQSAVASVSFSNQRPDDATPRVEIWITDRVTGKTTTQTIVPESAADAPTVISVRALELLRASLREFAADEPDVRVEGAHPERAKEAVRKVRVPPPPDTTVTFGVGTAVSWSLPRGSVAYGPEVSAGYILDYFGARFLLIGPFQGGRASAGLAVAKYSTVTLAAEPILFPIRSPRWTLGFFPTVGISRLDVRGEVAPPYRGAEDGGWLFNSGGGAEVGMRVSRPVEFYLRGRGFWLLPSPIVTLGSDQLKISSPGFAVGLGMRFSPGKLVQ